MSAHAEWFKGQLHLHTNKSDGNATPQEAAEIYKSLGFDFIVFTDHNISYKPNEALTTPIDNLLIIQGIEFTYGAENRLGVIAPVHANGIGVAQTLSVKQSKTVSEMFEDIVDITYENNAIPTINHPNFGEGFTDVEIANIDKPYLLEIANMHPYVFSEGTMSMPSCETIWDRLLSEGKQILGTATDDAHFYQPEQKGKRGYPNFGWIVCDAKDLTEESILNAIRNGDFYASIGIEIDKYKVSKDSVFVSVKSIPNEKYQILFIGKNGKILKSIIGKSALYTFKNIPDEEYVRVKIISDTDKAAWCQPILQNGNKITIPR